MNERRALFLGFHGPAEADGVGFGHVGAHDDDAIAVGQILLIIRRSTAAEGGAQTGHRGAMSYPGLVLDRNQAQCSGKELDEIVLFVVQRRPAQRANVRDMVKDARPSSLLFLKPCSRVCWTFWAIRSIAHSNGFSTHSFAYGARYSTFLMRWAIVLELKGIGALGAERALVDRAVGVTFDVDDDAVFGVDVGPAANRAIGADTVRHRRTADARVLVECFGR